MEYFSKQITETGVDDDIEFQAFDFRFMGGWSAQIKITNSSSIDITFQAQASNNAFIENSNGRIENPNAIWDAVPGSDRNLTNDGHFILDNSTGYYTGFRIVATVASGGCDILMIVTGKGI